MVDTGLDLEPIPADRRTARWYDTALVFAGANVVTTTLVTGGTLGAATDLRTAATVVLLGAVVGTLPIAVLARLGVRSGLPSMVILRGPFGGAGAAAISALLVITNFAWIALNNTIAAAALQPLFGGDARLWSLGVGVLAIGLAVCGPRVMALFDRAAVPLMALAGGLLTWALARRLAAASPPVPDQPLGILAGLDVVIGYQVSWSLMFADYTRFQRRESGATLAVLLGLTGSSVWLMLVGAGAGRLGGGNDPTAMVLGLGAPSVALLIIALSTITTNFVNLFLSALALRALVPRAPRVGSVLLLGAVGTGLGLLADDLLGRYADFMGLLATALLPIVAIALVHFFVLGGGVAMRSAWSAPALAAWLAGVLCYQALRTLAPALGATLPTLLVAAAVYWLSSPSAPATAKSGPGSSTVP
ncbi:MAG TPA: cytosine permease [Thermoanaerobaculia bacterium]|nr:cytosine permease [Thermoanaerobaculia bacterium]